MKRAMKRLDGTELLGKRLRLIEVLSLAVIPVELVNLVTV